MSGEDLPILRATYQRRLENGLTVLVREDHSAPVVAIMTHVKAGYFNEPDRLVGISHVLEHMYFKGTERFGAGEIARATKAVGGYLNAGTIYDYTSYYTVLPASALEHGLEIQSDALLNSEIDPDELRRELLVIIQEAKRKLDNPRAVARESLYEEMFDVHRIRRWRIGTEEGLRRLTREEVWNYYRELYRASNIVLVVAGDVDPERTFALVERFYGDMPHGEPVKETSPEEPERPGLRFREMAGDVVQTHMEWGWRTPGPLDPDTPALDLLSVVLGQGRASRLYRGVREAGHVTGVVASNYTPTELGVFSVSAELLPTDTRDALTALWREVEGVRTDGVGEDELGRARNILEARLLRNLETAEGQANLLARWQAYGDWRLLDGYLRALREATTEALQRVARDYLSLDRSTVLVYRPDAAEPLGGSAADLEALVTQGVPPSAVSGMKEAVAESEAPEGDAEGAPEEAAARAVREQSAAMRRAAASTQGVEDDVHFYELANGVRLAIKPRPSPLVSMGIFARGGAFREDADRAGITGLLARASLKGTRRRSARRIAEETEALGGSIAPAVGADLFSWSLGLPARHFAAGFDLLADVALRPAFPAEELERERKMALSDLEQLRDDMYRYPMRLFLQSAFPGHPYGFPIAVNEAALRRMTRDDLDAWHKREVLEGRPWVLVVGGVDPDEAAERVAGELDGIEPRPESEAPPRPKWPDGPHQEVERREKAQTALLVGFPGPDRNHPDTYALDVLSNAFSGLGGRLFEELRSRRSLAYTVSAYPLARWLGGAIVGYIATAPEREDEARHGLLEAFEQVTEETIGPDELKRAQEYTIGAWKIRSQTNAAQLRDLAGALLLGKGLGEIREFEARIREVTPITIRETVRRYFDPNRLVEGVVRGSGPGR